MNLQAWPDVQTCSDLASPGLLLNVDLVRSNLAKMLQHVGGQVKRLRPHVKTHKMSRLIQLQLDLGIDQFKVATLSEAEMVASCGAKDVLIAYPMVGPNLKMFASLRNIYPSTTFSCLVDHLDGLKLLSSSLSNREGLPVGLWIDVDCGMHRTGIPFGERLDQLRDAINQSQSVVYRGLHVYDGHLHQPNLNDRHGGALEIKDAIAADQSRCPSPSVVVGGSPTFGFWARETSWQCSPGTPVLWDMGYGGNYSELDFSKALALLTRVISKPDEDLICLDLGYKSIAAEMPLDLRVSVPELPDAVLVGQSEEHLVVKSKVADTVKIGDALFAFPRHICPTVALHASVQVIEDRRLTDQRWAIEARDRMLPSHSELITD